MGITNSLIPEEVTNLCSTVAEPNDKPGSDGLTDLDHFARIGCGLCHVPTLATVPAGTAVNDGKFIVPDALGNKIFHPYSDYLLHDIGTGDGISIAMPEHYGRHVYERLWQGLPPPQDFQVTANRMRTAPLWGLRMRSMLMHDGASLTFRDAIVRHRGEAKDVTSRFEHLSGADQEAILEFLRSL